MGISWMAVRRSRSEMLALSAGALALWLYSSAFSNAFISGGQRGGARAAQVLVRDSAYDAPGFIYEKNAKAQSNLEYYNDVGFFPDGTPYDRAGNAVNHPETIGLDPHKDGSALPQAV